MTDTPLLYSLCRTEYREREGEIRSLLYKHTERMSVLNVEIKFTVEKLFLK